MEEKESENTIGNGLEEPQPRGKRKRGIYLQYLLFVSIWLGFVWINDTICNLYVFFNFIWSMLCVFLCAFSCVCLRVCVFVC